MSFGFDEQIRAAPKAVAERLWADDWYGLTIRLPGLFAAFHPGRDADAPPLAVPVNLTGEGRGGPVTAAQYRAAERLVESDAAVGRTILSALAAAAPALNAAFGGADVVTLPSSNAEHPTAPSGLFLHDLERMGVALGVRLSCPIDEQRGLGALLMDGAVLGIGSAWVALSGRAALQIAEGDKSELIWAAR